MTFATLPDYKAALTNALVELACRRCARNVPVTRSQVNLQLLDVATSYFEMLRGVVVQNLVSGDRIVRGPADAAASKAPSCPHGQAQLKVVKKDGANKVPWP